MVLALPCRFGQNLPLTLISQELDDNLMNRIPLKANPEWPVAKENKETCLETHIDKSNRIE